MMETGYKLENLNHHSTALEVLDQILHKLQASNTTYVMLSHDVLLKLIEKVEQLDVDEEELHELEDKVSVLEGEIQQLNEEIEELSLNLDEVESEKADLEKEVDNLQTEVSQLQSESEGA